MTLIISVLTFDKAIQISDRRLTNPDGSVYFDRSNKPDKSNKSIFVQTRDTVFSIAYTGMAKLGSNWEDTDKWLVRNLTELKPIEKDFKHIVEPFHEKIIEASDQTPGYETGKKLTVVLAGFTWDFSESDKPFYEPFIINLDYPSSHRIFTFGIGADREIAHRIVYNGWVKAIDGTYRKRVKKIARTGYFQQRSDDDIVNFLVAMIRAAAKNEKANNRIGSNCMSVVVHKDGHVLSQFHPENSSSEYFAPHHINAGGTVMNIRGVIGKNSGSIEFNIQPSEIVTSPEKFEAFARNPHLNQTIGKQTGKSKEDRE